ncbi:hypothetical protein PT2222_230116 [Paraburkholderia tropica]
MNVDEIAARRSNSGGRCVLCRVFMGCFARAIKSTHASAHTPDTRFRYTPRSKASPRAAKQTRRSQSRGPSTIELESIHYALLRRCLTFPLSPLVAAHASRRSPPRSPVR